MIDLGCRSRRWVLACGLALSIVQGRSLPAAPEEEAAEIFESINLKQLMTIMKEEGYAVSRDKNGTLIWKINGFKTRLIIPDGEASNIQFHTAFNDGSATPEKVNAWNRTKRYSRTYLDDDGDPHLELDLDLEGGVTRERIVNFLLTCRVSMEAWCEEVVK